MPFQLSLMGSVTGTWQAKEAGSTRFCMGAAWRDTIGRKTNFSQILEYVKEIRGMGMEVCCTLGMIEKQQALELKKAGLTAYNHNLDTSREYYPNVHVQPEHMTNAWKPSSMFVKQESIQDTWQNYHIRIGLLFTGGIIGLGEAEEDRIGLLKNYIAPTPLPSSHTRERCPIPRHYLL
ncbi:biotin synthase [Tanacetum coccineum]